jgi:DNA polymerase-3 subunit gamma/tau
MVCRDEKTAQLLEAVESFRDRYTDTAAKVSLSWLVSALQVLNESEMNYKMARNKRLHVELALIRLTYLHQAIELTDENGSKKKIDSVKPVSFRAIPIVEVKPRASDPVPGAKLVIEEPKEPTTSTTQDAGVGVPQQAAKSAIDQEVPSAKTITPRPAPVPPKEEAPKTNMTLAKLRNMVANKQQAVVEQLALNEELLHQAWGQYIEKLQERNNPSAATNFRLATLRVVDDNHFDVVTESVIQQKFIEAERGGLIDHMQQFFHNRNLKYNLILEEKPDLENPGEKPLSSREQYLKMIEMYPLVKELRDRLGLDLDY